ncbi:hypothetical protein KFK09_015081 [Dendrobium nobile]|uniref:Peptidase A1 domain-containing protein n=1 Tax=Dendrobium nobile TaxID=94219 RepID=A0A8T3B679_DENNO|nr:hypothetical protein KFK09_015081 [Dendrobium nobile]
MTKHYQQKLLNKRKFLVEVIPRSGEVNSIKMPILTLKGLFGQPRLTWSTRLTQGLGLGRTELVVWSSVKETFTPADLHRWIGGSLCPDPLCEISSKFAGEIDRIMPEKLHGLRGRAGKIVIGSFVRKNKMGGEKPVVVDSGSKDSSFQDEEEVNKGEKLVKTSFPPNPVKQRTQLLLLPPEAGREPDSFWFFLKQISSDVIPFLSLADTQELAGEHHVIDVNSLLPSSSCSMPDKSTSPSKLTVVHRDGWCSSRARQDKQSHVELLRRDQARVKNIHRQAASATSRLNPVRGSLFARVPANIGKALRTANYIITIGLGTPTKFFTVEFDTGSDLSWTQCAPCYNCYTQKDPFYDPTQSSTFSDILCTSDYCFDLDQFGCSSTSTCLFHEEYHDYSYTNGSFIQDTLTFSSDIIQNFRYGCGHNNTGQFGQVDGLLGLGRGAISIISQTAQLYNKVFSYCLPSRPSATGYLELGSSIPGVIYTPMLTNQNLPSFYFLKLIAISVGGSRLDLSPTVFTDPGTMLDSGTVISYLPPTAYSALRNIFRQYMAKYPIAPPLPSLDTCYDLTNYTIMYIPSIALIFDGEVTATLDSMGIVYGLRKSQVCLAFTENNDDSEVVVIGNVQQRRFNVVYDVGNLKIGFGANGCD